MAAKTFQFEIVTPERLVLREQISSASLPTAMGEITVLADHIPLVAILKPGVIEVIKDNGEKEILSVSGGFVEVMVHKLVILADTAEVAHELDEERIKAAHAKAEKLKLETTAQDKVAFTEANVMVEKELARHKALRRWRRLKKI